MFNKFKSRLGEIRRGYPLYITRAGRNVIVELACIARTSPARQCPLTAGDTGQTIGRGGLTGRAGLGASWGRVN